MRQSTRWSLQSGLCNHSYARIETNSFFCGQISYYVHPSSTSAQSYISNLKPPTIWVSYSPRVEVSILHTSITITSYTPLVQIMYNVLGLPIHHDILYSTIVDCTCNWQFRQYRQQLPPLLLISNSLLWLCPHLQSASHVLRYDQTQWLNYYFKLCFH